MRNDIEGGSQESTEEKFKREQDEEKRLAQERGNELAKTAAERRMRERKEGSPETEGTDSAA